MATSTITGTLVYPSSVDTGIPGTTIYLGSPVINSGSSTGPQVDFEEGGTTTMKITASATESIPMGTVASGAVVYIGVDQDATVIFNAGAESISLEAGGFLMLSKTAVTSATITAGVNDVKATVVVLGD